MRESNKIKDNKEKDINKANRDQETINKLITKARNYEDTLREEERKAALKKKMAADSGQAQKKVITIAHFVGELTIPSKVKFAMYDQLVQTGDDTIYDSFDDDEMSHVASQPEKSVYIDN